MLDNEIIYQAAKYLEQGLSQRETARRLGISHTIVNLIHRKKRKPYSNNIQNPIIMPKGNFTRCPVCGGKTQLPCVYCQIKKYLKKKAVIKAPKMRNVEEIKIELTGEYAQRYQEIRQWRTAQENPHFTVIPDNWPWEKGKESEKHQNKRVSKHCP